MTEPIATNAFDRRERERREADLPFEGPERRTAERRSGRDRRASPRS